MSITAQSDDNMAVSARGLSKAFGARRAVDRLDLALRRGSVLCLLGANGAGKSTTLRLLYGLIEPDAGEIRYFGTDFRADRTRIKRWIGVCGQADTIDYEFRVRDNLAIFASYFHPRIEALDRRIDEVVDMFDLGEYVDERPDILSGGYKRRLMIARSVIHEPRILYLDEPTTGLDPGARFTVWEIIDRLRGQGLSIILTTHYMDEAERLSDELLVMSHGTGIATGTARTVLRELLGDHVAVVERDTALTDAIWQWAQQRTGRLPNTVLNETYVALTADLRDEFTARFAPALIVVRRPRLDDLLVALSVARRASP